MNNDLPKGYRWATEDEVERYASDRYNYPEYRIVSRTTDSSGIPYRENEADIAVPIQKGRPNKNYILQLIRDDDIAHDPWGTALSWAFGVAEVLATYSFPVPEEMHYSAGMGLPDVTEEYPDSVINEYLAIESEMADLEILGRVNEIQFAGKCLMRYVKWCEDAGKSY